MVGRSKHGSDGGGSFQPISAADADGGQLVAGQTTARVTRPQPPGCCGSLFAIVLAGAGFMTDAYDLFVINTVVVIVNKLYSTSVHQESIVATAALLGSVGGQLLFGLLADRIGRRKGFIATCVLLIVGALASAMAVHTAAVSIYSFLACARFVEGVGIGGEYPLSATISSESSDAHHRGTRVAAVFSMQGMGMLLAPLVGMALLAMLPGNLDLVWRLMLGFGAVPAVVMLYWRCTMKETQHFVRAQQRSSRGQCGAVRRYWKQLLGTAGCWFLFDITFYANGLFSTTIIEKTHFDTAGDDHHQTIMGATQLNTVLVLMAIPGYWCAVYLIDRIGRRKLQMGGFLGMAVCYLTMGGLMGTLEGNVPLFFLFYGLSFFFSNCGPNTTTFVLPSEVFPTEVRATCHGVSAAAGKIGAVVGGAALRPVLDSHGLGTVMVVCGAVALLGFACTYALIEEPMGKTLEELRHPEGTAVELTSEPAASHGHSGTQPPSLANMQQQDQDTGGSGGVHTGAVVVGVGTVQ